MDTPSSNKTDSSETADTRREIDLLLHAARESLTDTMVERLAITAGTTLAIVDRLNDEDTADAVHSIIDKITEFHRLGALDTLFESVLAIHAVRDALTDNIIERGVIYFERIVNTVGSDVLVDCIEDVLNAIEGAAEKSANEPQGGALSTFWLLLKPESQQTIRFLLNFGSELRRARSGKS
ncbi:MAG: hypothetical protein ACU84Q_10675 [Gammaproteobacteria bacterium]